MSENNALRRLSDVGNTCTMFLQRFFDKTIRIKESPAQRLIELFCIKYLYIFLTVLILEGQHYHGSDGYRIDFVLWKELIASVVFFGVSAFFLSFRVQDYFLRSLGMVLHVLYFIPLNSAFSINNASIGFFLLSHVYYLLLIGSFILVDRLVLSRLRKKQLRRDKASEHPLSNRDLNAVFFLICILYFIHKLGYNGLDFSLSLDSQEVYAARAEYQAYLQEISGTLFSYALALIRYIIPVLIPFYIVSALIRRKLSPLVCIVLCGLSMYSVSMQKSVLFVPILAVGIYLCYRLKLLKHFERLIIVGILLLLILCLGEHFLLGSDKIYTLFIRREMYYPAWLNHLYYEFFSQNDKIHWTQQTFLMQNLLEPVYTVSPLDLINNAFFNGEVPSPNTGLFAEAYMHFGVIGVLLYPLGLTAVITALSLIYKKYGPAIQITMVVKLALSLTNVPIVKTDSVISIFGFAALVFLVPKLQLGKLLGQLFSKVKAVLFRPNRYKSKN